MEGFRPLLPRQLPELQTTPTCYDHQGLFGGEGHTGGINPPFEDSQALCVRAVRERADERALQKRQANQGFVWEPGSRPGNSVFAASIRSRELAWARFHHQRQVEPMLLR